MNKEEILNQYQELLKEYQEAEISRRNSIEEERKLKEKKDIAEQKIEFEEAKERFEPDNTMSTEDIVKRAKLRQESLNGIENERINAEKNVNALENKKREIRKTAEEYYNNFVESGSNKLDELTSIKAEKAEEIEAKRNEIKLKVWVSKDNSYRTTEEYAKLENELKESMQGLMKIQSDIDKERERLDRFGKQERMGIEVAYRSFINGADRIDDGKFIETNKIENENVHQAQENRETTTKIDTKSVEDASKVLSESVKKMKSSMEERPTVSVPKIEMPNQETAPKAQEKSEENKDKKPAITKPANRTINNKKEDPDLEKIDLEKEQEEITKNSKSVRILYSAKRDKYLVTNVKLGKIKVVDRKDLDQIDKRALAEVWGKDLDNVDINVLQVLMAYDKQYKTTKATEYVNMLSTNGKSKKQRQAEMQESQIDIEYNLKGLYNKYKIGFNKYEDEFSKEEKEELLSIANNASKKGIATVKKGLKVNFMEIISKITRKANNLLATKKVKKLPVLTQEEEQELDDRVNKDYWKSINPKKYEKALKQAQSKNVSRNEFVDQLSMDAKMKEREERRERDREIMENKKQASELLKQRAQRLGNTKFEYKDNNYVPTQREDDGR